MASFGIFPVTVYGQASDVYGTAVTAYASTNGVPPGSGLILGQFVQLFDSTVCRLLKANAGINQYNAIQIVSQLSNDYTVQQLPATANTLFCAGANDRAGSTALVANNYAWMTTYGIATCNVVASQTAPAFLVSSGTAGSLQAATAGTSLQSNILLLNTSTTAGPYPVLFR
jgi:hypothetical protein